MCKDNKIEFELEKKINAYWNNFVVVGVSLKDHIGRMGGVNQEDILKDDST